MCQRLAWHSQFILGLWTRPKCDLDEVEKAMIQVVKCHFEVIFCLLTNRNCNFKVDKTTIQVGGMEHKSHIVLLNKPKIRLW